MRCSSCVAVTALAAIASAQAPGDCDPTKDSCPNNPAMSQTWDTDFTIGKDAMKGWKRMDGDGDLTYGPDGIEFTIASKDDSPTIGSLGYLHYGYVEVVMKAAPGVGVVSAVVLMSDDKDEVDWEWLGGVDSRVQQNYYGKGNTTTYDRMIEAPNPNNQNAFHSYALNWTAESLTWIIDGKPTRTLKKADANGGKSYPQSPCNIRMGNWPGGSSDNEGVREWAGGNITYSKGPFKMTVKSVKAINYSPGKEYKWSDKTGNSDSIQVIGAGNAAGAPKNDVPTETSDSKSGSPPKPNLDSRESTSYRLDKPKTSDDTPSEEYVGGAYGDNSDKDDADEDASYKDTGKNASPQARGAPQAPEGYGAQKSTCGGGTFTVTVSAAPPHFTNPMSSIKLPNSLATVPIASSARSPVTSLPPYPISGIEIDTRPPPSPTNPSVLPSAPVPSNFFGSATSSVPVPVFSGAASHNKAGLLAGAMAGAVFLAV